ncbi:hypothetical protein LNJ03_11710 [Tenacibaculum dicentrarchi]|nr:hypothetical protein [Tenacibaculum dicentrarchi]
MYKTEFGTIRQIRFSNENEYYETMGYLAKSDNDTAIKWERNKDSGAWDNEGRIEFFIDQNTIPVTAYFKHTAGNGGKILSRANCNEFVKDLVDNHSFRYGFTQNDQAIRLTVPLQYQVDFDRGLAL